MIRKILKISLRLLVFVFFFLSCNKTEIEPEVKDVEIEKYPEIKEWFDYLCSPSLGGRYSGSEGINKALDYIINIIGYSDSLEIDSFDTDKCKMNNIIFHIKGESDSLIVLGAHYDAFGYYDKTPLPGADDNLSGTSVLLSIISKIKDEKLLPKYSIDICLFDGEEIGLYGSRHYVAKCKNGIKVYINVDTCGNKDFGAGFYYDKSHPYLREEFSRLIAMMSDVKLKVAEYNPQGYTTDCYFFGQKNIPFVSLMNDNYNNYQHTTRDDVSHISFKKIDILASGIVLYLSTH